MLANLGYDALTDSLIESMPALTTRQFAALAIACADQAGLDARAQEQLAALLERVVGDQEALALSDEEMDRQRHADDMAIDRAVDAALGK